MGNCAPRRTLRLLLQSQGGGKLEDLVGFEINEKLCHLAQNSTHLNITKKRTDNLFHFFKIKDDLILRLKYFLFILHFHSNSKFQHATPRKQERLFVCDYKRGSFAYLKLLLSP